MIQIDDTTDSEIAPLIICDFCGERISDVHMAAALTLTNNRYSNGNARVAHVHKGPCFDAIEQQNGGNVGWAELSQHLRLILNNVGLDLETISQERDIERQFGMTNE